MLSAGELARYARQLALPEVALAGQERLRDARVVIVGAGGLGSPAALYLAAAGVGTIGIVDDDLVELSNLHRQILHTTASVHRGKADSAREGIARLNPHVNVRVHSERLTSQNGEALIADYDLVVDGSDNYATRYAVNDACISAAKVWIYGSVERFSGQLSVFGAADGPCYRCIFPEPPAPGTSPSCEDIGVLGAVPGVIGSLQAVEALKWLLGIGVPYVGRLLQWDLLNGSSQQIAIERRRDCRCTGRAVSGRRDNTARVPSEHPSAELSPADVAAMLEQPDPPMLLDVREAWEWRLGVIGAPRLLAMEDLPDQLQSLDPDRELVVYCHHGVRSRMAAEWLRAQGYRARNLTGGTDRWSREIDPSLPRY